MPRTIMDPTVANKLAARVLALYARATVEDVKARVEIGALLTGHGRELREIALQVGIGERSLRHSIEVRARFSDDELAGYFGLARVPPWSALVVLAGDTSRRERERRLRGWADSGGGVRGLRGLCGR